MRKPYKPCTGGEKRRVEAVRKLRLGKTNEQIYLGIFMAILLAGTVLAWVPPSSIDLKSFYSIINATTINAQNVTSGLYCNATNCYTLYDFLLDTGGGSDTQKTTNGFYLYNDSSTIYLNETQLNDTIDSRDSDTTYTAGSNLSLTGTVFSLNATSLKNWLDLFFHPIWDYDFSDLINVPNFLITDQNNELNTTGSPTFVNITVKNLEGNLDWTNLTNYPVACPEDTYLTELGDSVVCSSVTNSSVSNSSNYWDNLNSPEDIQLFVKKSGDNMTGNLWVQNDGEMRIGNATDYWVFYQGQGAGGTEFNVEHRINGIKSTLKDVYWSNRFKAALGVDLGDSGKLRFFDGIGMDMFWDDGFPEMMFNWTDPVDGRYHFTDSGGTNLMEGDWNFTRNVTALRFIGDGSQLTGITGGNSSWNESRADGKYVDVTGDTMTGALTVGADSSGNNVKFFSDTAGDYMIWNASASGLMVKGTSNYVYPYTVNIMSSGTNTNLGIFNDGGLDAGVFFGVNSDAFELYNFQAGNIDFFTHASPSAATLRFQIKSDGDISIPDGDLIMGPSHSYVYWNNIGTSIQGKGIGPGVEYLKLNSLGNIELNPLNDVVVNGNLTVTGNLTVSKNINVAGCINYNGGILGTCV